MPKVKNATPLASKRPRRSATTPEAREDQLINLAYNLVEQRLLDGTATSQETVHFLRLGSTKILERQKDLITAKTEAMQSQKEIKTLYAEAIKAFGLYSGQTGEDAEED